MVKWLELAPWFILFCPLVASILITLFFLRTAKIASFIAMVGILISLGFTLFLFSQNVHTPLHYEWSLPWIDLPAFRVEFGFLIDSLSLLMLLVVTGVGTCIFLYSMGYMHKDPSYARFFATLSFFAFSMLGIVLANNFFQLFIFWELVAVSSYLLISFWFEKPSAADAGNKAFIVNRLADFGLVLGIFFVWMLSGVSGHQKTFNFLELSSTIPGLFSAGLISVSMMTLASLLVFCGVVGKSAQFPLYIWLPDAMEGPTPVSALIHAATMVAAGVYLFSRSFFLVANVPNALEWIASIGLITATLAGLLAVVQNDIKKILAYSTISQLGYMVLALGLGAPVAAMYHLTTHAFFKALLFLGAGAIIHALHTQDIWHMGSVIKKMPLVSWTFILGMLALSGIYPLSGFFSKDEILHLALEHNRIYFAVGLFNGFLTAFYMSRLVWIALIGPERARHQAHGHHGSFHDAPWIMKTPLLILAVLAAVAGFIGIPHFIEPHAHHSGQKIDLFVAITSSLAALSGMLVAFVVYQGGKIKEEPLSKHFKSFHAFVVQKYYLDHVFSAIGQFFQTQFSRLLYWFDFNVIMSLGIDGTAAVVGKCSHQIRKIQSGAIKQYGVIFILGILTLICYALVGWKG